MRASPSAGNLRSGPGELSARPEKFSDRDGPAQRNFETESARSQMAEISNTALQKKIVRPIFRNCPVRQTFLQI